MIKWQKDKFFWKENYEIMAKEVENHCHFFQNFDVYYLILKEMRIQDVKMSDEEIEELIETADEVIDKFCDISTFAVVVYIVYLKGQGYTLDDIKNLDKTLKRRNKLWFDVFHDKALEYMKQFYPQQFVNYKNDKL